MNICQLKRLSYTNVCIYGEQTAIF